MDFSSFDRIGCRNNQNQIYECKNYFKQKTNLKEGSGDACAGHKRFTGIPAFLVKVKVSEYNENFGFVPPIGSEIKEIFQKPKNDRILT